MQYGQMGQYTMDIKYTFVLYMLITKDQLFKGRMQRGGTISTVCITLSQSKVHVASSRSLAVRLSSTHNVCWNRVSVDSKWSPLHKL